MWKSFITKKMLVIMAVIWLLTLASLGYLKVAYGYQAEGFEDWSQVEESGLEDEWGASEYGQNGVSVDGGWWTDEDGVTDEGGVTNKYPKIDENIFGGEIMGTVSMSHKFLDGDILKISVTTGDMVMPVLGLAFHLNYDGEKVKFLKYEPGEFLERGGDPFYLVQNDERKNEIVYGETLRRDDSFPIGEGRLIDFYFQLLEKEAMKFEFENGAVSTLDVVRQDIDRIVWENLELDKNGRKIMKKIENGSETVERDVDENIEIKTSSDAFKLPENFVVILIMGIVIIGLTVWIFIDKKKKSRYRGVISI